MSTYADLINDIRMEVVDEAKSRWSDAQMLRVLGWAIRRISGVLQDYDIEGGRYVTTVTTIPGQQSYTLPRDFNAPYGLYRDSTNMRMQQASEDVWARMVNPLECSAWLKRGSSLLIASAPTTIETLTLVYWPTVNTQDMALDDLAPWEEKFDDAIVQYAALRLKNIDEMNVGPDVQIYKDVERQLISTHGQNNPMIVARQGWCP